jgi:hypothetical protein
MILNLLEAVRVCPACNMRRDTDLAVEDKFS